jgi:hypothetical protein
MVTRQAPRRDSNAAPGDLTQEAAAVAAAAALRRLARAAPTTRAAAPATSSPANDTAAADLEASTARQKEVFAQILELTSVREASRNTLFSL